MEEYSDEFRRPVPPKGRLHKGVVLQHTRTPSTIPAKSELEPPPVSHVHHSTNPPSPKNQSKNTHSTTSNNSQLSKSSNSVNSTNSNGSPNSSIFSNPKSGFSVQSKRSDPFAISKEVQLTPGPGSYRHVVPSSEPSASRKGAGNGFVSSTNRFPEASPAFKSAPGPGQYYDIKKDSSIKIATNKIIPNYADDLPSHEPSPGPGSYSPHDPQYSSLSQGSSAFRSNIKRTEFLPEGGDKYERRMGPGKYDVTAAHQSTTSVQSTTTPFRSMTRRALSFDSQGEDSAKTPGPGAYYKKENSQSIFGSSEENSEKNDRIKPRTQGRLQDASRIADNITPEVNKASPGPGEYIPIYNNDSVYNNNNNNKVSHPSPSAPPRIRRRSVPTMPGSSFASTTHRIDLAKEANSTLGPGEYHEEPQPIKQSFNANRRQNWV